MSLMRTLSGATALLGLFLPPVICAWDRAIGQTTKLANCQGPSHPVIVVDGRTGEPLAHYALASRRDLTEVLSTDGDARVSVPRRWLEEGIVALDWVHYGDIGQYQVVAPVQDGTGLLRIEVDSGPSFRLSFVGEFKLVDAAMWAELRLLRPYSLRGSMPVARAPMRLDSAGRPTVRFPRGDHVFVPGVASAWVRLRNHEGTLVSDKLVRLEPGECDERLAVELRPCGAIDGVVWGGDGAFLSGVHVWLAAAATETRGGAIDMFQEVDRSFSFECLPPGHYSLTIQKRGYASLTDIVEVQGGERFRCRFDLGSPLPLREVRLEIVSQTGEYAEPFEVILMSTSGELWRVSDEPPWLRSEVRGAVATARLSVPDGRYSLALVKKDLLGWQPDRITVSAGGALRVVTVIDDVDAVELTLNVSTEERRALEKGFTVYGILDGEAIFVEDVSASSHFTLPRCPISLGLQLIILSEGYVPARLDFRTLAETPRDGWGSSCDVKLRRGWGCLIKAVDETTGNPVTNAKVMIDGEYAGRTGRAGDLWVERPEAPSVLAILKGGYSIVDNNGLELRSISIPLVQVGEGSILCTLRRTARGR